MSNLRIALVAEGPSDAIIIESALKALLAKPFVITQLQPEPTRPKMGTGWGGVLRWCRDFASRGYSGLEDDPTLPGFDLSVLHVDADVAEANYADVSPEIAMIACSQGWPALPCSTPCPPPSGSADAVRSRLLCWLNLIAPGPKTVFCVPSKAPEAWLVASVFDQGHRLLNNIECNLNLADQLKRLPVADRIRKTKQEYLTRSQIITETWDTVRELCTQAERFSVDVLAVLR
jgi:hypothetical protein